MAVFLIASQQPVVTRPLAPTYRPRIVVLGTLRRRLGRVYDIGATVLSNLTAFHRAALGHDAIPNTWVRDGQIRGLMARLAAMHWLQSARYLPVPQHPPIASTCQSPAPANYMRLHNPTDR
jgi:hypothetical protein